ncbi:hypothetical protein [Roseixanthobacter pseudopolyaromaticivorans]|uniref:hypothetical protein n=1 Tax=Roseixanthobacter pseudopolyaromaticivorans TaxID=3119920 RepID=UPI003729D2CD
MTPALRLGFGSLLSLLAWGPLPAGAGETAPPESAAIALLPRPGNSGFANFVRVSVGGGAPGAVLLDTGSTGLRIRADAVGPDVQLTDIPLTYSYSSGNVLEGVLGYAVVSFPDSTPAVATPHRIAVQVVQKVTCKTDMPDCPGWKAPEMGVMGVAYNPVEVFNPLAQLGGTLANGFIVVADDFADPNVTPHLVVGLTPQNSTGFSTSPFAPADGAQPAGLKAWNTKSIPTCFTVDSGPPGCFATVFDTGAGSGSFETPDLDPSELHTRIPAGHRITTSVAGAMSLTVESGRRPWINRYRYAPPHGGVKGFNSGGLVFRHYKVLFDAVNGRIGFSPALATPAVQPKTTAE